MCIRDRFDSCHSGTVTRGAPDGDDLRIRQLPPGALGIPEIATTRGMENPQTAPEAPFDAGSATGSFVAFFAAQTNEVTPEKNPVSYTHLDVYKRQILTLRSMTRRAAFCAAIPMPATSPIAAGGLRIPAALP